MGLKKVPVARWWTIVVPKQDENVLKCSSSWFPARFGTVRPLQLLQGSRWVGLKQKKKTTLKTQRQSPQRDEKLHLSYLLRRGKPVWGLLLSLVITSSGKKYFFLNWREKSLIGGNFRNFVYYCTLFGKKVVNISKAKKVWMLVFVVNY